MSIELRQSDTPAASEAQTYAVEMRQITDSGAIPVPGSTLRRTVGAMSSSRRPCGAET